MRKVCQTKRRLAGLQKLLTNRKAGVTILAKISENAVIKNTHMEVYIK